MTRLADSESIDLEAPLDGVRFEVRDAIAFIPLVRAFAEQSTPRGNPDPAALSAESDESRGGEA